LAEIVLVANLLIAMPLSLAVESAAAQVDIPGSAVDNKKPVKFGVLAFRAKPETAKRWQPLVDYLNQAKLGRHFELEALTYPEMVSAVHNKEVDLILTQPGLYVLLTYREGLLSPLATLTEKNNGYSLANFGGVIVTRANDNSISTIANLRGKRIATSMIDSLGSYQMQAFELLQQNIHLPGDARLIEVSTEGFSLFLDYQLRHLQTYHVQLQVFRNATTYRVDVQAQCVYAALVRSEGFRHGFQFGPLDSVAEDALLAILA
jgi:ABC-type phosphate/phosphonate transport system substrate-binding protein